MATSPYSENTVYGTTTPSANVDVRKEDSLQPPQAEDLVHLTGPITEEAIVTALQARFGNREYLVSALSTTSLD